MGNVLNIFEVVAQSATEGLSGLYQSSADLEQQVASTSARITLASAALLLVLAIAASLLKDRVPRLKMPIFLIMMAAMIGSTIYLAASTIYVNVKSDSGGPVHWHADIEIWACGNELELRDPFKFLSNKIGSATLHEHDDRRVHLEGVVVDDSRDATLGKFFHVIDGALTSDALVVPLNKSEGPLFENDIDGDGPTDTAPSLLEPYIKTDAEGFRYARFVNGNTCGNETAAVQAFVLTYNEDTKTYAQEKIADPLNRTISPYSTVPPGDCVIIEFDVVKDQTNKLCEQYGIRDIDRCQQFGVGQEERGICEVKQVGYPAIDPNGDLLQEDIETDAPAETTVDEADEPLVEEL